MNERQDWHELAQRINEVNDANGWVRPGFPDVPVKVMLAVTELDEGVQGAKGIGEDPFEVEIADTAIRLLHLLESIWPGDWKLNGFGKGSTRFQAVECLVWPILSQLCAAVEAWRHEKRDDVRTALEIALRECRRVAETVGFDLLEEMKRKTEINAKRGYLHGKANPAG